VGASRPRQSLTFDRQQPKTKSKRENVMQDKQVAAPDNTAVRVALWRALVGAADSVGLRLRAAGGRGVHRCQQAPPARTAEGYHGALSPCLCKRRLFPKHKFSRGRGPPAERGRPTAERTEAVRTVGSSGLLGGVRRRRGEGFTGRRGGGEVRDGMIV
jgi:hypothetical protein